MSFIITSQTSIKGTVSADGMPLPLANVVIKTLKKATITDSEGHFNLNSIENGTYEIQSCHLRATTMAE